MGWPSTEKSMQLTLYTDYSLRVMAYLAQAEKLCTITEIADYFGVSRNHLVKVVHNLSTHGLIRSSRGKGGGIQLARPANTVSLGDVVRITEPNFTLVECFNAEKDCCAITRQCGLKNPLYEAQRAFMAVLDRSMLADATRSTDWNPIRFTPGKAK
jgi:Rrf2 family nitric oxide-sensitive transcriptional repressor